MFEEITTKAKNSFNIQKNKIISCVCFLSAKVLLSHLVVTTMASVCFFLAQTVQAQLLASPIDIPITVTQKVADQAFRIIGENDLVLVDSDLKNVPKKFHKILPAIGWLSSSCTVTHIGNGLVITAGHCFWQTFFGPEIFKNEPCSGETVEWMKLTNNQPMISKCEKIIAMQRDDVNNIDYALFKVSPYPDTAIQLDFSGGYKWNRQITVFSYPNEAPLTWSGLCHVHKHNKVEFKNLILHQCDTEPGSSGAPLIDAKSLKIIGLHVSADVEPNDPRPPEFNIGQYLNRSPLKSLLAPSVPTKK